MFRSNENAMVGEKTEANGKDQNAKIEKGLLNGHIKRLEGKETFRPTEQSKELQKS